MGGNSNPYKYSLSIVAVFLVFFLLIPNCGNQELSLEPLPGTPPDAVLTGTLRAGDTGVADATVRLEPVVDGVALSVAVRIDEVAGVTAGAEKETAAGIRVTVSDSRGRYAFDGLDAGSYLISAQAEDHLAGSAQAAISRDAAAAAGTTFVDIDLVPTGTFTGNATLQNATDHSSTVVYVTGSSYVAVTDALGDYELSGVPIGDHTIQATHTGWLDQSTVGTLTAAGDSVGLASLVLPREANMAPIAEILPLPSLPALNVYEPVAFEATATDPDGTIELVEWDFEDDGVFDHSGPAALNVSWMPPDSGSYRAKIRVTDDKGAIGLAVLEYHVYDAIYVWGEEGSDSDPGTMSQPVQTIQQGITLAEPLGLLVIVHAGSYWEEVQFKSYVSVWGGYDSETGWTRPPGSYSEVWLQSFYEHVATANNITNATIRGLEIEAETAQGDGKSAVALKLISCDSSLKFVDCRIIAGSGTAALTAGADGTNGIAGGPGQAGESGCEEATPGCSIRLGGAGGTGVANGGNGGIGGYYFFFISGALYDGEPGDGPAGGLGGASFYDCTSTGSNGGNALANGQNGSSGQNATPIGTSYGTVVGNDWVGELGAPGASGQDGQEGSGGGGGGAVKGATCHIYGAGGGGGGGAGGLGGGGASGNSGGASIAVLCIGSTSVFDSCLVQTGNGGNGWRGGDGGVGGLGGIGALGGAGYWFGGVKSGDGGDGSDGGNGGSGGGAQGGPGGPSIGVYNYLGSIPTLTDITWSISSGGAGGPGGTHGSGAPQAGSGPAGPSGQVYNHP
jgi:hypothetical protein